MDAYDFVHLALLAYGGSIKGKTKFQKVVYFLGVMTGHLDDLGYRAHFYGPYSGDVDDAINRLSSLDFVTRTVSRMGAVDRFGFEVGRNDYVLNDQGRTVAQSKARNQPMLWGQIEDAARKLQA